MNRQYKHIFDKSACITRRQMKDYLSGNMIMEECHAFEHHINDCTFCSEALDGVKLDAAAIETLDVLDTHFLNEHFAVVSPEVHLNSMGPRSSVARRHGHKHKPIFFTSTIAILILLAMGIMWYVENRRTTHHDINSMHIQTSAAVAPGDEAAS